MFSLPTIYWPTEFTIQHQIALFIYLIFVVFLVIVVNRKKKELDSNKPKYENTEFMRGLFTTTMEDRSKLEISLVRYHKGSWKDITGKIVEVKRKVLVLQTNLTIGQGDDYGTVPFRESDLESHIMTRFSMNNDVFSLFFFETSIISHRVVDNLVELTVAFPRSIGETQRRGFVRHFLKDGDVQRLAIWNAGSVNELPPTVQALGNPVYVGQINNTIEYKVINISARGIQIEFTKEADQEKKINLINKNDCIILISLSQHGLDTTLNLWLHIEPRFHGAFEGKPRIGCEVLAWSEHPMKGQPFSWAVLDAEEEVPDLLAWVATEMASQGKAKNQKSGE